MLTYELNEKPLYICVYKHIKADIQNGILKPNEKLPSKRALADHLKISVITVENAYDLLASEGYIKSIQKKGYFVEEIFRPYNNKNYFKKPQTATAQYTDLTSNIINTNKFPFQTWSKLMRQTLTDETSFLERMPFNGVSELREAISNHLYSFRGFFVDPENIYIGAGAEYLYNLIPKLFPHSKSIAVENPCYSAITKIYELNGLKCFRVNMDESGLMTEELKQQNLVHVSPSHHFPTGITMPMARRTELLRWAEEETDRYIIEDEYDSEFRFNGKPIPPLISYSPEKVLYLNTFSKSVAPNIRIAYMVLPTDIMQKLKTTAGFFSCAVSGFEQHTLAKFISGGYFERHINRMRLFYKAQRDVIIKAVNEYPKKGKVKIIENNAGTHLLLKLQTNYADAKIKEIAKENGILITCLSEYYKNNRDSNEILINYSSIDKQLLIQSITKLLDSIL
ncbi:MAG TPA: PLP-dependent aminotransferase family protein [Clostridia bacterium]|nr:PLP-dependent aminotransferase family protein [Clostridia bacterium]